ncbi:MAG: hypothetical protein EBT93_11435 [Alphaproteobacteria bacterium]|nr:hypothetical protein [Alphaproteobacteria bacterium]
MVTPTTQTMKMSEALDLYLSIKGKGRDKRFFAYAKRAIRYLFVAVSDKPISSYTRSDAIEVEILVSQVTRDGKVVNKSMKQITKVISFKGERLVAEDYEIGSASDFYPELDDLFSSKSEDDD